MTALDLAHYIITKCTNEGTPISNLQLQKILYFIQKGFLQNGKQAFWDNIEAWQFGPVVPSVYFEFCGFGATPIFMTFPNTITPPEQQFIDKIINENRSYNPWMLVEKTHKTGGAWDTIYQGGRGNRRIIPQELICAEG